MKTEQIISENMIIVCKNCHTVIEPGQEKCPKCGAKVFGNKMKEEKETKKILCG